MQEERRLRPGQMVNRLFRLQTRWLEGRLGTLGLAPAQVPVLAILKEGPRTQAELTRLIGTEQPTMAQLLGRMERSGLVRREADRRDGRRVQVLLTEKARTVLPEARAMLEEGSAMALKGMTAAEVAQLEELLGRVLGNVERAVLGEG